MADQERKVYTPSETAKLLGISVASLKYHRMKGHIEGTDIGNMTLYTEEQIQAADLSPEKPGPKPRSKRDDDREQGGRESTVMFKRSRCAEALIGAAS